jgi:hypothetical protein
MKGLSAAGWNHGTMEPLPCKNNCDFAYVNGFSVFANVLDMVTLMLQVFVGEGITL